MPPHLHPLTRRTTLALAGLGLVGLAGCDDKDAPPPGSGAPATVDPDRALADGIIEKQTRAWQRARTAGATDLLALHEAHLDALGADTPTRAGRRRSQPPVRQVEARLRAELVAASMSAQSGELARLFASMSAAIAQQLEVL